MRCSGAIGGRGKQDARGRLIYVHNGGRLMVSKPMETQGGRARQRRHDSLHNSESEQAEHRGTKPGWQKSHRRDFHQVFTQVGAYLKLTFAILTATNCARFMVVAEIS